MKEILNLDYDEMDVSDPDKMTILPHNWKEDTALMLTVTDRVCKGIEKARFQSTHSLRSATSFGLKLLMFHVVSIHALLAECDPGVPSFSLYIGGFNPRTPCGVRLIQLKT